MQDNQETVKAQGPEYPAIFADIAETLAAELVELGFDPQVAGRVSFLAAEAVRRGWKGSSIYIPGGREKSQGLSERDAAIFAEFEGSNWRELCLRHGISRARLYQILAAERDRTAKARR